MSNFHVGQKVVCVSVAPSRPGRKWYMPPIIGEVYTISGFGVDFRDGDAVLFLEELKNVSPTGRDLGYRIWRFRPVAYPKQSLEHDVSLFKRITQMVEA